MVETPMPSMRGVNPEQFSEILKYQSLYCAGCQREKRLVQVVVERAKREFPQSTVKDVIRSAYARHFQEGVNACNHVMDKLATPENVAALRKEAQHGTE
jgi:hypothetical protein